MGDLRNAHERVRRGIALLTGVETHEVRDGDGVRRVILGAEGKPDAPTPGFSNAREGA